MDYQVGAPAYQSYDSSTAAVAVATRLQNMELVKAMAFPDVFSKISMPMSQYNVAETPVEIGITSTVDVFKAKGQVSNTNWAGVVVQIASGTPAYGAAIVAAPANATVGTDTGVVTWHVLRGANCVQRWGIAKANSCTENYWDSYSLSLMNTFSASAADTSTGDRLVTFQFGQDTLVSWAASEQPQASLELENNFAYVRINSGFLSMESTTTPVNTNILNGSWDCASIDDTRAIWQTSKGTLSRAQLSDTSVTKKDSATGIRSDVGVIAVVGSDLSMQYITPNPDRLTYSSHGVVGPSAESINFYADSSSNIATEYGQGQFNQATAISAWYPTNPFPANLITSQIWGSPQDVKMTNYVSNCFGVPPHTIPSSAMPNIACYTGLVWTYTCFVAAMWTNVEGGVTHLPPKSNGYGVQAKAVLQVHDIYNTLNSDGVVVWKSVNHQYPVTYHNSQGQNAGTVPTTGAYQVPIYDTPTVITHVPVALQNQGQTYMGTYAKLILIVDGTTTINTVYPPPTPNPDNFPGYSMATFQGNTLTISSYLIAVPRETGTDRQGEVGPARVIKWQDMAPGQQLTLNGVQRFACVAKSDISPYIISSGILDPTCADIAMIPIAAMLFNSSSTLFKRVYDLYEYRGYRDYAIGLRLTDVKTMSPSMMPTYVVEAIEAAGFFDRIGKSLYNFGKKAYDTVLPVATEIGNRALHMGKQAAGMLAREGVSQLSKTLLNQIPEMGEMAAMGAMVGANGEYPPTYSRLNSTQYSQSAVPMPRNPYYGSSFVPQAGAQFPNENNYPIAGGHYRKRHRGYV